MTPHEIDLEMNTSTHTPVYLKHSGLLIGIPIKYGDEIDHYAIYNPSDSSALYHILGEMSDKELYYINLKRKEKNKPLLPRLARILDGKFKRVMNLAEKHLVEYSTFKDHTVVEFVPKAVLKNVRYDYHDL